jgi:hypothetical protein
VTNKLPFVMDGYLLALFAYAGNSHWPLGTVVLPLYGPLRAQAWKLCCFLPVLIACRHHLEDCECSLEAVWFLQGCTNCGKETTRWLQWQLLARVRY